MLSSRPQSLLKRFWLTTLRPATAVPLAPPMAAQASTSGRTAVRVPGPVETSMQQKVGHELWDARAGAGMCGEGAGQMCSRDVWGQMCDSSELHPMTHPGPVPRSDTPK